MPTCESPAIVDLWALKKAAGTFPRVRRLDAARMLAAVREAAGVELVVSGVLDGGQVGAARVRWPDGHEGVLKWRPDYDEKDMRAGPLVALEAVRARGYPAPAAELVVQVGSAVVTVQELLPGNKIDHLDERHFDQALAVHALHVGALAERPDVPVPRSTCARTVRATACTSRCAGSGANRRAGAADSRDRRGVRQADAGPRRRPPGLSPRQHAESRR